MTPMARASITAADNITGDTADDILIAGYTSYDEDPASLNKIQAEWNSARSYDNRVANLRGTQTNVSVFAARSNGMVFLRGGSVGATVFDDGVADTLTGSQGTDWFIFNNDSGVTDNATDAKKQETTTDINPPT